MLGNIYGYGYGYGYIVALLYCCTGVGHDRKRLCLVVVMILDKFWTPKQLFFRLFSSPFF
jgi:hypothetical protein